MALVSIIKYEGDKNTIVWRHPEQDFNMGSQLIVHESQEAVFFLNGEVLDTFGPGMHSLVTENLPIARRVLKIGTGSTNPFHAELYFVNLTELMAIRWGTDSKVSYIDPIYSFPIEIGASGEMSLSVVNSNKLLIKLVGTENTFTQEKITLFFRSFLMNRVKSILAQEITAKQISIFEIDMHLQDLSASIKDRLADDFFDYGIKLNTFLIMTIVKPDEDKNYLRFKELHYRQKNDVMEAEIQQKVTLIDQETKAKSTVIEAEAAAKRREIEGYSYQQERSFDIAEKIAENEAVGQIANVGVGLGMVSGVGGEIGKTVGNMVSSTIGNKGEGISEGLNRFCGHCGHEFLNDDRFCPKCGTKRG